MIITPMKTRSLSTLRYRCQIVVAPRSCRRARGRVSGRMNSEHASMTAPYTASTTKMPRHGMTSSSADPTSGARTGATPETSARRLSMTTRRRPPKRSRTIAMATTPPAAAPIPWNTRAVPSSSSVGASAAHRLATMCSAVTESSGMRRPTLSLSGPTISCPRPKPIMVPVSVSCTIAAVVWKSLSTIGNAGR